VKESEILKTKLEGATYLALAAQKQIEDLSLPCARQDESRHRRCRRCGGAGEYTGGYENGDILSCSKTEDYKGPCVPEAMEPWNVCAPCKARHAAALLLHALEYIVNEAVARERESELEEQRRQQAVSQAEAEVERARAALAQAQAKRQLAADAALHNRSPLNTSIREDD